MTESRYTDPDGAFELSLPAGWEFEQDEEGGILIGHPDGSGLLHLISFPGEGDEDPGAELYSFLEEQEIQIEEDEVEDMELECGSLALCEYLSEDEDETVFWLVGVATAPGSLVFVSYSCPLGEETTEREIVRKILGELRLTPPAIGG